MAINNEINCMNKSYFPKFFLIIASASKEGRGKKEREKLAKSWKFVERKQKFDILQKESIKSFFFSREAEFQEEKERYDIRETQTSYYFNLIYEHLEYI